jgi:hypothetical protein
MKLIKFLGSLSFVVLVLVSGWAQEVSVAKGTGYGTYGIYGRTFGAVIVKKGTAIKYVPDTVNGDSFVIQVSGLYAVSYSDGDPSTDVVGISVNLPSTTSFSIGWGTVHELCAFEVPDTAGSCSATVPLTKGNGTKST